MAWEKQSTKYNSYKRGSCEYQRVEIKWLCPSTGDIRYGYWNRKTRGDCDPIHDQSEIDAYPTQTCNDTDPDNGDEPDSDPDDGGDDGTGDDTDDSWIATIIKDALALSLADIVSGFDELWDSVIAVMEGFKNAIANGINNFIDGLIQSASDIISSIGETIADIANDAIEFISSTASNVLNTIKRAVDDVFQTLTDVFNDISNFIDRVSDQFFETIETTFDSFTDFISDTFNEVVAYFGDVAESVIETIDEFIQPIIDEIDQLFSTIGDNVDELFNSVSETIDEGIQSAYDTMDNLIVSFSQTADELADELTELTGGVLTELDDFSNLVRDNIGQPFADLLNRFSDAWFMQDEQTLKSGAAELSSSTGDPFENLARYVNGDISYSDLMFDPKVKTSVFGLVLIGLQAIAAKGMLGLQAVHLANGAKVEKLMQDVWTALPIRDFSFPEAVSINVRGFLTDDQAETAGLKSGFDSQHFQAAKQAAEAPLNPEKANAALFRGFINEDTYQTHLKREGFNEADRDTLRRLAHVHPPVQDLITMAVREVFSPAIADKFRLFGDLPEAFVVEAEKGGLTKEWAEKYWGAHWRLPSANQGFAMLHRGFIDEETLDMLIKALDVSPFWREPLKKIAYQPVTRVDIRRMLKLELIDADDAQRRYQDIGYSPEDAILMTAFAISLLDDTELDDEIDFRELTRTQIKVLYLQGTFSKGEAIEAMEESGYSADASLMLVGSWETARMISEREELLNMVISKAIREHMTVNDLEKSIFNLQLTPDERDRIGREIVLRGKNYTSIPSKSELLKMYTAKIISGQEWFDTMMQHNYSEYWVGNYAKLAGVEIG